MKSQCMLATACLEPLLFSEIGFVMHRSILLLFFLCLTACAPPKMYNWGNYEQGLYNSYKDPSQTEALRVSLEEQVVVVEAGKQKMPPGLYAELGTLYLKSGSSDKAKFYYTKEMATWPESATLMTALIQNIDRQNNPKSQSKGKK